MELIENNVNNNAFTFKYFKICEPFRMATLYEISLNKEKKKKRISFTCVHLEQVIKAA